MTVLIVLAFIFSGPFSFRPSLVEAQTADALLKSYASKDTDNDGLPDWQEALYGTDPANPESVKKGVTDGDAVAQGLVKLRFESDTSGLTKTPEVPGTLVADDTLTAQFSREFFSNYIQTTGGGSQLTQDQINTFAQQAVNSLAQKRTLTPLVTSSTVQKAGSGDAALRAYATTFETLYNSNNPAGEKNEVEYFSDATIKNDPEALAQVKVIAGAYKALATSLARTPVPTEAASAHIEIVNALNHYAQASEDMGAYSSDPLRAWVGMAEYRSAVEEARRGFADMASVFTTDGVVLNDGTSGYLLYQLSTGAVKANSSL